MLSGVSDTLRRRQQHWRFSRCWTWGGAVQGAKHVVCC